MINFELNEEQQMIRDTVRAFATERVRPAARPADENGTIPEELTAEGWALGLVRGAVPEALGGDGSARSAMTGVVVAEELAYGDFAIACHMLAPRLLAYPILEMGTEAQRGSYLKQFTGPRYAPGAAALAEPRFDFDPAAMETAARPDGRGGFILNGRKCMVPMAQESEVVLVYAAAGPGDGFDAAGGFIVERGAAGLQISAREKNMGLKGLATYELTLKDCRVAAQARLGGEGGINFSRLMSESRAALAAMAVGVMRAAFDYARDYAKARKAFGVPIATKQAIAFILADMAIEIDAARLLAWEAAWHLDRGEDGLSETYLARNYAASAALKVTDNAVQVLGGHGYIRDHPVEMWLRNARGLTAFEGLATV